MSRRATRQRRRRARVSLRGAARRRARAAGGGSHRRRARGGGGARVARQELELLLAKMRESRNRGEHISAEQLALFTKLLREQSGGALSEADRKLAEAAQPERPRAEPKAPPKQPRACVSGEPAAREEPDPGARGRGDPARSAASSACIAHETTEVAELIPAEVIVRQDIREVLACRACDAEVVRAPMEDKVIAGGAYGSCLVSDLVVGKYWDSLPLNRQAQQLERLGLSIPSSSMADQITWATDLLRPIYGRLQIAVLLAAVMHVDSTSIPVRDSDSPEASASGRSGGTSATTCAVLYTSTGKKLGQREGEMGRTVSRAAKGPVVADMTNLFDASFEGGERVEVGCNMHGRRYFVKALDAGDARATNPIAAFRALYDVEDAVRAARGRRGATRRRQRRSSLSTTSCSGGRCAPPARTAELAARRGHSVHRQPSRSPSRDSSTTAPCPSTTGSSSASIAVQP